MKVENNRELVRLFLHGMNLDRSKVDIGSLRIVRPLCSLALSDRQGIRLIGVHGEQSNVNHIRPASGGVGKVPLRPTAWDNGGVFFANSVAAFGTNGYSHPGIWLTPPVDLDTRYYRLANSIAGDAWKPHGLVGCQLLEIAVDRSWLMRNPSQLTGNHRRIEPRWFAYIGDQALTKVGRLTV